MENEESLELDLFKSDVIITKCKDKYYAQNLYAALCNNRFFKNDKEWTCSWRVSGGLIADLRNCGEEYIDWYCSGILLSDQDGYVAESVVTDEIRADLLSLGWTIKPYEPRFIEGVYKNTW